MSVQNSKQKNDLSALVNDIFDRYTVIPSSDPEEEEVDELCESFENLNTSLDGIVTVNVDQSLAICPPQLTSPQALTTASPNDLLQSEKNLNYEKDGNKQDVDIPSESCDRCSEQGISCRRNPRGKACTNCRSKRKKCSLVPEKRQIPGAMGTSTDNSSTDSESSYEEMTGDESFEYDSKKVTLQRVFGHLLHLQDRQKESFENIEGRLKAIERRQNMIQEDLGELLSKY